MLCSGFIEKIPQTLKIASEITTKSQIDKFLEKLLHILRTTAVSFEASGAAYSQYL